MIITEEMIKVLAAELALVRNDNEFEGTELFVATMNALETQDTPETNKAHNDICALADAIEAGKDA